VAYGALLGVSTWRANPCGATAGMLFGLSVELYLRRWTKVPWTWWVMIGTIATYSTGYLLSLIAGMKEDQRV